MTDLTRQTIVPYLISIFERRGAEAYLGEDVTMSEHMMQAAHLAEGDGADEELIAAALLHDIGHFTSEFAFLNFDSVDNKHDQGGAAILEPFFGKRLVACVRLHVAAKRYLCAVEPSYFEALSAASVHSLGLQGGPMTTAEIIAFEHQRWSADAVQLRRWDEAAKVIGLRMPPLEHYGRILERVLASTDGELRADLSLG